ncbi:MAG TPA: hypothetical protein VLL54_09140 [Pyrinomonadaceae bacterium]|nr:hypothetical protein [Pyrinomonadaceae bacterium]
MKEANNNEVDLLLRSLARRGSSAMSNASSVGNGGGVSDHLDADELNSYAEGVLPVAARARYSAHLADCDDCRRLVVSLNQVAGATTQHATPEKVGANFWQKLAGLFSLPVIRFAVPALMLTAVIGVGLLVFWQQRGRNEVAQSQAPANSSSPSPAFGDSGGTNNQEAPAVAAHNPSPSTSRIDELKTGGAGKNLVEEEKSRDAAAPLVGTELRTDNTPAKDGTPKEAAADSASGYRLEPRPASEPPPPPPAKAMGELAKANDDERAERPAKREDQNRQYEFKGAPNDERGPSRAAQQNNAVVQSAQNGRSGDSITTRSRGQSGLDKNKKTNEVDSRTVAGRRFVRDGDAWVDTAYDSSKTAIRVNRGSEQFRALVADEPAIRTIADQLSGVVIVVWQNRTYRIQ